MKKKRQQGSTPADYFNDCVRSLLKKKKPGKKKVTRIKCLFRFEESSGLFCSNIGLHADQAKLPFYPKRSSDRFSIKTISIVKKEKSSLKTKKNLSFCEI